MCSGDASGNLSEGVGSPILRETGNGKRETGKMDRAGYGLIETLRVREGRLPFLERHLARLERSFRELDLPQPSKDVARLVRPFAGTDDAVVRVEVCDGRATVTVRELPARDPPLVITASEPHEAYPHKTPRGACFRPPAGA